MKLHFVDNMDQVLAVALEGPLPQMPSEAETRWLPSRPRPPRRFLRPGSSLNHAVAPAHRKVRDERGIPRHSRQHRSAQGRFR